MFILAHHRDVPRIQLFAECLRKGLHSSLKQTFPSIGFSPLPLLAK